MLDLRAITPDELAAFADCFMTTFGGDGDDPALVERLQATLAPLRAWAAFDDGAMVATAASYPLTVGVPGGTLGMAGLAFVTVRPSHRRQGLLRRLMAAHLDDARAHGEPLSGLWASEGTIYGRFGFGIAMHTDELTLDARAGALAAIGAPDAPVWLDDAAARARLPAIYARAMRPGMLVRGEAWWAARVFADHAAVRDGASRLRRLAVRRDGVDVGYVLYRQRGGMRDGLPNGTTEIVELVAVDPRAEASLWRFLAGIDLFPTARWDNAPRDSVLPWIASEPRRVQRRTFDTLWLRINDVAAALAGRRYAADGALRLATGDASYTLTVEAGAGRCAPGGAPELCFEGSALASAFLGGAPIATLARAGKITGSDDAIERADRMFRSPLAPWCPELF